MAKTAVKVELYYSGGWHDITATDDVYTRDPIRITRGRANRSQRIAPSTVSLSIKNMSGKYSPRNPTSALYGLIGRNTPIRVTVGSSVRFVGEVESWPQRWNVKGTDVWAPIVAYGILRRLNAPGRTARVRSAMRRAVDLATVAAVAYWALDGGSLSTVGQLTAGTGSTMAVSNVYGETQFGAASLAPWLEQGVSIDEGVTLQANGIPGTANPAHLAVDFIRQATAGQTIYDFYGTADNAGIHFKMYWTAGAFDDVEMFVYANGVQIDYDGYLGHPENFNANSHHVRVEASQNGGNIGWVVYIDGVTQLADSAPAGTLTGVRTIQAAQLATGSSTGPVVHGHFAYWETLPVIATMSAAAAGYPGETAAARITRLCTEDGIAVTIVGPASDSALVGVQRLASTLDSLYDAADADGGILYEPRDSLGLAYRVHADLYNQTAALALNYSAGGEVAPELAPVEDTDSVTNDVTVTRYLGGSAHAVQSTGPLNVQEPSADPNGVGRIPKDFTLVLNSDDQTLPAAAWFRHLGTWDEARYPVVNLDLTAMDVAGKSALITSTAALNIGDRFTIANPPAWLPPDTIVQTAQGFTEVIESHRWSIAANATPSLPYEVLQLETGSGNRSRIPTGGSTLAGTMTTTSTSRTVTSPGAVWIDSATYAAQFPFDVMVGGERMSVTAIVGTTSPQTFTVTRSVNGVVKTQASGEAVQLFHAPVIAR